MQPLLLVDVHQLRPFVHQFEHATAPGRLAASVSDDACNNCVMIFSERNCSGRCAGPVAVGGEQA